jgi:ComF family protein
LLAAAIRKLEPEFAESEGPVLVVTVPLHGQKQRARGFNQSELIARSALGQLKRDWKGPELQYRPGMLARVRSTATQTGLTRHQRRANLRNAFRVERPKLMKGSRVLLLDDVLTTGSTIAECARTLKRAGATNVWAATIARVFRFSAEELDRWHFNGLEPPNFARQESQAAPIQHPMG